MMKGQDEKNRPAVPLDGLVELRMMAEAFAVPSNSKLAAAVAGKIAAESPLLPAVLPAADGFVPGAELDWLRDFLLAGPTEFAAGMVVVIPVSLAPEEELAGPIIAVS